MVTKRWLAGCLAFALLTIFGLVAPGVRADALDDQVREIAKGLRCPVCSGETVADSNAPLSVQMRGIIREKLTNGESPDQIRAYFVARYGSEILLTPPAAGFTLGVWLMPIIALAIGVVVVAVVLRSWSRRPDEAVAAVDDAASVAADLPATEEARLEQELARFRQQASGDGVRG